MDTPNPNSSMEKTPDEKPGPSKRHNKIASKISGHSLPVNQHASSSCGTWPFMGQNYAKLTSNNDTRKLASYNAIQNMFETSQNLDCIRQLITPEGKGIVIICTLDTSVTTTKLKKRFISTSFGHCIITDDTLDELKQQLKENVTLKQTLLIEVKNISLDFNLRLVKYLNPKDFILVITNACVTSENIGKLSRSEIKLFAFDNLQWSDLSRGVQEELLMKELFVQESVIRFSDLLHCTQGKECKAILETLPRETLFQLLYDESPTLCKSCLPMVTKQYVERQLAQYSDVNCSKTIFESDIVQNMCRTAGYISAICISGDVGSGKSTTLKSIGQKLLYDKNKHYGVLRFVQYVEIPKILAALQQKGVTNADQLTKELVLDILHTVISDDEMVIRIFKNVDYFCHLLVDGLDEVSDNHLNLCVHFLSLLPTKGRKRPQYRLWLSVGSSMVPYLKRNLQVRCYSLVPLSKSQQKRLCERTMYPFNFISGAKEDETSTISQQKSKNDSYKFCEQEFMQTPLFISVLAECSERYSKQATSLTIVQQLENFLFNRNLYHDCCQHNSFLPSDKLSDIYKKLALETMFSHHYRHFESSFQKTESVTNLSNPEIVKDVGLPTFSHKIYAYYFIAKFIFEKAVKANLGKTYDNQALLEMLLDIIVPNSVKLVIPKPEILDSWNAQLYDGQYELILYFLNVFFSPDYVYCQAYQKSALHTLFANIFGNIPIKTEMFEMLQNIVIGKPYLAGYIISSLGTTYEPLKFALKSDEGCKFLSFVFGNVKTEPREYVQQLISRIDTPVKLLKYTLEKAIVNYCKEEHGIVESQCGNLSKNHRECFLRVENAFYWKLIELVIKNQYSTLEIHTLSMIIEKWFRHTETNIVKLRPIIIQEMFRNGRIICQDKSFEEFFLAEFVFRMGTYGNGIDLMKDLLQCSVEILLNSWMIKDLENLEKSFANEFGFLALLNSLLVGNEVKSNFLEEVYKAVFENETLVNKGEPSQKMSKTTLQFDRYLLLRNIDSCATGDLSKKRPVPPIPHNVISILKQALESKLGDWQNWKNFV